MGSGDLKVTSSTPPDQQDKAGSGKADIRSPCACTEQLQGLNVLLREEDSIKEGEHDLSVLARNGYIHEKRELFQ